MEKTVGIIGLGSMGGMLLERFIAGGVHPEKITVANRSAEKTEKAKAAYPELTVGGNEDAAKADIVFICVEPGQFKDVVVPLLPVFKPDAHLVSIASTVTIANIETLFSGKITKMVPTLTSRLGVGITLVCYNDKVEAEDKQDIEELFAAFGELREVPEEDTPFITHLTSSGPGLFAEVLAQLVAASKRAAPQIPEKELQEMILETFRGTLLLSQEMNLSFDSIVSGVATRGGITEAGVSTMREAGLDKVFDALFDSLIERRKRNQTRTNAEYEQK